MRLAESYPPAGHPVADIRAHGLSRSVYSIDFTSFLWKLQRKVFGQYIGKMFYQHKVDSKGQVVPLRRLGEINRWLMEQGCLAPWIFTKRECHEYWMRITNDERHAGNRPDEYATKPQEIFDFLQQFWSPEISRYLSVLELGCNCGANLQALFQNGLRDLRGVDINPYALEQMKVLFPELAKVTTVRCGSLEDVLPTMKSNSVDVVFTMGVLIHVHPQSNSVFQEMVRVARKYVVLIENEVGNCAYVFARNHRRVFERLGCTQIRSTLIMRETAPNVDVNHYGSVARLFSISKNVA